MAKIIGSPGRYIQAAGVTSQLGTFVKPLGDDALVLLGSHGTQDMKQELEQSFAQAKCSLHLASFGGECSESEIQRLRGLIQSDKCTVVVGIGGGKIIDTAKAVACHENLPVVVMPTAASSDAPCSSLSVIYTDDHVFKEYLYLPSNPDAVIVDTQVIAKAPPRLLAAGMGDALATYFEARACERSHSDNCLGGNVTSAAMALARLCYDTLMNEGLKAVLAANEGIVTPALERIVEANTYLSGVGFESGGLAVAHAVHNGLTMLPGTHELLHGEKVAFGTITQLVMEDADTDELQDIIDFCLAMELPVTFADLGIADVTPEELMLAAERAAAPDDTAHHMPFPVDARTIYNAMIAADALGRYYSGADEGGCCGHDHC